MKELFIVCLIIFMVGFSSGAEFIEVSEFGYNNLDGPILSPAINYSELPSVNSSEYWNTGDLGPLRNVGDILHNWLNATSLLWSNAGHIMDSLLDMNGNNIDMESGDIVNVNNIVTTFANVTDTLTVENISLGDSIKDQDTTSRAYYEDGVFIVEG